MNVKSHFKDVRESEKQREPKEEEKSLGCECFNKKNFDKFSAELFVNLNEFTAFKHIKGATCTARI